MTSKFKHPYQEHEIVEALKVVIKQYLVRYDRMVSLQIQVFAGSGAKKGPRSQTRQSSARDDNNWSSRSYSTLSISDRNGKFGLLFDRDIVVQPFKTPSAVLAAAAGELTPRTEMKEGMEITNHARLAVNYFSHLVKDGEAMIENGQKSMKGEKASQPKGTDLPGASAGSTSTVRG
ncbi:hypothetical protein L198_06668 [Cryptococcus wingfieldii CBS 7118]|uniref:Uncharacterized protein n=1 Tax=Cryptococcus wingfieldii CBS 7118 TaxID=1295528 RepID=A0A1E3IIG4_9TREE|nr:hypothetical protein L198_06668 [Cryptococcus wingfieldii CBS 7118]ODN88397.1 hypothetical protein L198_06668 [Cryptococcus wingfieldii CBS 7118]